MCGSEAGVWTCRLTITVLSLQADLVNTIGESVAMGTAGTIMWDKTPIKTQVSIYTY